jgi:hypothetical protein
MLCNIGITDKPFSVSEYSTLGGISSYDFLDTISSAISAFNVVERTASVIFTSSALNSLYLNVFLSARTHITLDFHLPPNTSRPYSNGHLISDSNFLWYINLSFVFGISL